MKRLVKILVVLTALGLVAIGGLLYFRDRLIRAVVVEVASDSTGVPCSLESVSTGLGQAAFAVDGLEISNPQGFSAEPFMRLGRMGFSAPFEAFFEDPLRIAEIEIEGLALRIERSGTDLNYEPIVDHIEGLSEADDAPTTSPEPPTNPPTTEPTDPDEETERTVIIDRVRIADWRLHLDVGRPFVGPQELGMKEVVIHDLRVTGEGAQAELIGRVLDALLAAALTNVPELPAELGGIVDVLSAGLADGIDSGDLDSLLERALEEAELESDELLEQLEAEVRSELESQLQEQLGEQAAPLVDEAKQRLGELFGGG
ncbi:MAG: hypothetical protein ACYTFV_05745 [Planctomycetota bacterium]|jgi:hypothetical protein